MPTKPGCYALHPTAGTETRANGDLRCPQTTAWTLDQWGMDNQNAGNDANACLVSRKNGINSWCGSTDLQMTFIAPKPTAPGCYALHPTAGTETRANGDLRCPQTTAWTLDQWGTDNQNAGNDANACLVSRK